MPDGKKYPDLFRILQPYEREECMANDAPDAGGMTEVVRMAGMLADRLLDAQIMRKELPDDQVRALVDAALLMEERGVPWPPMMSQVLQTVEAELRGDDAALGQTDPAPDEAEPSEGGIGTVGGAFRRLIPALGRRRD
jgi:hypothetical protein